MLASPTSNTMRIVTYLLIYLVLYIGMVYTQDSILLVKALTSLVFGCFMGLMIGKAACWDEMKDAYFDIANEELENETNN